MGRRKRTTVAERNLMGHHSSLDGVGDDADGGAGTGAGAEAVNHPPHYGGDTTYETIKVLRAWELDRNFCLGNAVKYLSRAGKKDPAKLLEDLRKAAWYLADEIAHLEGKSNK